MATIVIVDDLAFNRDVLASLLRTRGHTVLEAADGKAALALTQAQRPSLVIVDVFMPVMSGYELARQIRADAATAGTPIVFYAPRYCERDAWDVALKLGVFDVILKPFDADGTVAIVDRALAGSSTGGPPAERVPRNTGQHLRVLTGSLSQKSEDLANANARLRALINVGLELASERNTDKLLQNVCSAAGELFGASYITLGIIDLNDRTVQRVVTWGTASADWITAGSPVPAFLNDVIADRRTMRADDAAVERMGLNLPPTHPHVHAFLAAPLASPEHVYGWFCLLDTEGRAFTEDDEALVTALSGQVGRIYETGHYIAVAENKAKALELEQARTSFALQSANVGIWDLDAVSGALQWSDTMHTHYGVALGAFGGTFDAFVERVHPEDRAMVLTTIAHANASGTDFALLHRALWPDGTVRWLRGAGRVYLDESRQPIRAVGVSLDVTERHALEAQFQQAHKLEAIGRLAGGVAHDFNNLLTIVLCYCEMILPGIPVGAPHHHEIEEIEKAAKSAARLTRQLMAFSRTQAVEPALLDINAVVADVHAMLSPLMGEHISLAMALKPGLSPVQLDRGHLEQIVMNLALNARDAMPNGGTLTIETANTELDAYFATTHLLPKPGHYVALTVTDTGIGISPEVSARLFEPFFTTKEPGEGTGLGLATVHGIVKRGGGSVTVYSEVGRGTSFKVYFPRAASADVGAGTPVLDPTASRGTEVVLLVEDSQQLRELTERLLVSLGYTVLAAANAREALALAEQTAVIDVMLTDVVMPGLSGVELAKKLIDKLPLLKVIYMSGYTEETLARHGVLAIGIAFLNKPFTSQSLGQKIRAVVDRQVVVT